MGIERVPGFAGMTGGWAGCMQGSRKGCPYPMTLRVDRAMG